MFRCGKKFKAQIQTNVILSTILLNYPALYYSVHFRACSTTWACTTPRARQPSHTISIPGYGTRVLLSACPILIYGRYQEVLGLKAKTNFDTMVESLVDDPVTSSITRAAIEKDSEVT